MDLSTTYLGLKLPHPFMPGASPLVDDLATVRRLEDAGAAAITMHSLFEEQIRAEELTITRSVETHGESFAEASSYLSMPPDFTFGPDEYLEQIRRIKAAVSVPVVASLNGVTRGGWLEHARLMEQAGADAIELNVFELVTDPAVSGQAVEERLVGMLAAVKKMSSIPVSVKLSPFYSSLAHVAARLDEAGADGLVLFNRFYQPDLDIEDLQLVRSLEPSTSAELNLRLRWLAILSGRIRASLAVTGGVHGVADAVKTIMSGAHAVQMVSVLLRQGPEHLTVIRDGVATWLEEHGYNCLEQMQGSMSLERCPDPSAF
ncbi:MAG: dihydroorotate dehydrogenase-like protein, partial [Acidobacteriota bacterium]